MINTHSAIVVGSRLGGLGRYLPFYAEVKSDVDLMNPLWYHHETQLESLLSSSFGTKYFHFILTPLVRVRQSGQIDHSGCNTDVNPAE